MRNILRHRSEGDAQNAAAAPERPAIPNKDAGAALGSMPPGDTQSFAHWSEGDAQDAAAGRPASPGEAGGAVPDGNAAALDRYTKSQLLRQELLSQQLLRQQQAQTYRPLGPGDCSLHWWTERCQKCGDTVKPVHMMIRLINGFFLRELLPGVPPCGLNSGRSLVTSATRPNRVRPS